MTDPLKAWSTAKPRKSTGCRACGEPVQMRISVNATKPRPGGGSMGTLKNFSGSYCTKHGIALFDKLERTFFNHS